MKFIFAYLLVIGLILPVFPQQEKITEKVEVEWWVVPIFAVDKDGKSVLDLGRTDIRLKVNNRDVENFTVFRRSFTSAETAAPEAITAASDLKRQRTKNVFLLFDTAMSSGGSTEAAKYIAQKIVRDASPDTRFFVMVIEPFAGLSYAGGQTTDKDVLIDIIAKKVKPKKNARVPNPQEIMNDMGGFFTKYDESDLGFFLATSTKYYKRKTRNFMTSFESLYYALNTIKDNKFVYLFSEGVSYGMRIDAGDESMYQTQMGMVADYLGRCGAVLFVVNPSGETRASAPEYSGEDSLRILAEKSGGKYLSGRERDLLENIGNIHQAYYEIFFPASVKSEDGILKISVTSNRQGVGIHTLKTTEKTRDYADMKDMEREVLALNLVSGNPLFETNMTVEKIFPPEPEKKTPTSVYKVTVPQQMVQRKLDLYKIYLTRVKGGISDTRVEKQILQPAGQNLEITFKNVKPQDETYFVLVDGAVGTALVHGIVSEQEKLYRLTLADEALEMKEAWSTQEKMTRDLLAQTPEEKKELARLLTGAALYCEILKKAAFHYTCKEHINEEQKNLKKANNLQTDVTTDPGHPDFTRPHGWIQREEYQTDKTIATDFLYRLIKVGEQVREERDLAKNTNLSTENEPKKEPLPTTTTTEALKGTRFVSSKALFGPITLLAAERQGRYRYKLLERTKLKDRPVAVIEALPKNEKDAGFVYGKVWIDTDDFSVLKINANPNSIVGYQNLTKLADELGGRLILTLETQFFKLRNGIRFPTRIHFLEHYKGGRYLTYMRGASGWKRTETVTDYTDFLFFDIGMDVTYKKE